jgi:hypothetical protein
MAFQMFFNCVLRKSRIISSQFSSQLYFYYVCVNVFNSASNSLFSSEYKNLIFNIEGLGFNKIKI